MTQGMMRMARNTLRPVKSRFRASAAPSPSMKANTVDEIVQMNVLAVTRQNTSLLRISA